MEGRTNRAYTRLTECFSSIRAARPCQRPGRLPCSASATGVPWPKLSRSDRSPSNSGATCGPSRVKFECPLWVESGHSLHYDRAIEYQPQTKDGDTTGRRPRSTSGRRGSLFLASEIMLPSTRCPLAQSDQIIAPHAHVDPHQRTYASFRASSRTGHRVRFNPSVSERMPPPKMLAARIGGSEDVWCASARE